MSEVTEAKTQGKSKSKFSIQEICYVGLFTAVIAVMAQISIPMPMGVPMTMQTFAITLAAVVLGAKLSTISCVVYLLLGAVGVPVLANFSGGFDKFVGPTGGFLISFPLMAFIIGWFVNWMKTWKLPKWCEGLMPVMFIPVLSTLVCGMIFLCVFSIPLA